MQVADSSLAEMSLQLFNWLGVPLSFPKEEFMPFFKVGMKWMLAAAKVGRCCEGVGSKNKIYLNHCSCLVVWVLSLFSCIFCSLRAKEKVGIQFMLCGCRLLQKWVAAARVGVGRSRVCRDSAGAAGAAWSILELLSGTTHHHPPPLPTS